MPASDSSSPSCCVPSWILSFYTMEMERATSRTDDSMRVADTTTSSNASSDVACPQAAETPDNRITTTAEVMEMARDIGRKWGDLHEIFVWEDGVKLMGNRLYYFQAIHQESDVIPENVDCIRALMGTEPDWRASVAKTDAAISAYYNC